MSEPETSSPDAAADAVTSPGRNRAVVWILAAVVVLAGGGYAVYAAMNQPIPDPIPGAIITEQPPQPTLSPSTAANPTELAAAMPTAVLTYALTSITPINVETAAGLPGRVGAGVDTTYRDGATVYTVTAYQYYNVGDATAAWESLAAGSEEVAPVTVGGVEVGSVATVGGEGEPFMVWRNDTVVLLLAGPTAGIAEFYEFFAL